MQRVVFFSIALATAALMSSAGETLIAQAGVIERSKSMTIRGEVIEISCYQKKGIADGSGAAHAACAKECAQKGLPLGLLTDGDGIFRIVGPLTNDKNAKLLPFLGKRVELSGTQVLLSNSYDVRQSFDAQKITALAK